MRKVFRTNHWRSRERIVAVQACPNTSQVWSASINGNPDGYAKPFYLVTIGCLVQWALSFFIR